MQFTERSVVVTGSEGQLGAELCRQLGAAGVGLTRAEGDLLNKRRLAETLERLRPAVVINTAAYTAVDRAESEPTVCHAVNARGVAGLAEICRGLDCVLVQVSTDYVFGGDVERQSPYSEEDEPGPVNVYGESKLAGEGHAASWQKHFIVRTCGLYGARVKPTQSNFVDTMLRLGRERERLRVVDDQYCTPSYTVHVARAILFLAHSEAFAKAFGTYHVVNQGGATWHAFASEIFRQAGLRTISDRITTSEFGALARRPAYSVLDTRKYEGLAAAPLPAWQFALAEYLQSIGELRYPPEPVMGR
jgi:dTDP-4-dehydrorhamnose reductase